MRNCVFPQDCYNSVTLARSGATGWQRAGRGHPRGSQVAGWALAAGLVISWVAPRGAAAQSYTTIISTGYNLLANQLDQGSNTLNEILPVVPDGSVLFKYDNGSNTWEAAAYSAAAGTWEPGTITLNPGEGAFFQSPTNFTLTFTGTPHAVVRPVTVPSGASYLLSRQTNAVADYESIMGAYPPEATAVYRWDPIAQEYGSAEFLFGSWLPGPTEPVFAVGEAVWISPSGAPPPAIAAAPLIVGQPIDLSVQLGQSATFAVTAVSPAPPTYQWFFNSGPIPGATNAFFTLAQVRATDYGVYSVAVGNSYGALMSGGARLLSSEFLVTPVPNSQNCCWDFVLDQSGGAAGDISSFSATVLTPGAVIEQAAGSGDATLSSQSAGAAAWSLSGASGLSGNPQTVTLCFSSVPHAGAAILFTAAPLGQTNVVLIGTNGGCSVVVQVDTNRSQVAPCCDVKTWQSDGPFPGKDYSFLDPSYGCGVTASEPLWPAPRYGAAMVYHDQTVELIPPGLLLFGGSDSNGVLNNETWMWNGKWWQTGCDSARPIPARCLHAMAFDSDRLRTVLFGGLTASGLTNDLWEWDSAAEQWGQYNPPTSPAARQGHAMAYFPDTKMTVLFGGLTASGLTNDTWLWDGHLQVWLPLTLTTSPSARQGQAMIYDPNFDAVLLLGGTDTNGVEGDLWKLTYNASSGYAWSEVFPFAVPPRTGHGLAYDPACDQLMVFGGFDTNGLPRNDTWLFDEVPGTWTQPAGSPPTAVGALAAAFYPPDKSLAIFGGNRGSSSTLDFAANASAAPTGDLEELFYNPNPIFNGNCTNNPLCQNIVTGPLWARTLLTDQFSFRDNGNWFNNEGSQNFTYRTCVGSDQYNTTFTGRYPSGGDTYYLQPKAESICDDTFSSPQFGCTGFSLPSSPQCAFAQQSCQLYADYALNGDFCPYLNLNLTVYDHPFLRSTKVVGIIYADGVTAHFADSVFPAPCVGGGPYDEYLQYGNPGNGTYTLSSTLGPYDKIDLRWHISQVGLGAATGELNPCATESGGPPCALAYFEFDQAFGSSLRLKIRVQGPDLNNAATLASEGGKRDYIFYVDADNSRTTGDQCCFDQGADFYVRIEQTLGAGGSSVVTSGSIYRWNPCAATNSGCANGAWEPEPKYFYDVLNLYVGTTEILATVPMAAVGDPQGCYSAWVVSSTPNDPNSCPLNSLPGLPACDCRMVLPRITDTNCPYLIGADTSQVTGQPNLSAPVVVTFNKPMSVIDASQIVVSPYQAVNTYLVDPADSVLNIRPASGTWKPGCYTITLGDNIRDASGNTMCTNYTFNLCVPDLQFFVTDPNGTPTNFFNPGDSIYVHGCGFTPNSTVSLYLVTPANVQTSGRLLADWTATGPKQVAVGPDGCLPTPTILGAPAAPMDYKVVADVNGDGIYETNLDVVSDLCGLGFQYGQPCTNLIEDHMVAWWPFAEASATNPVNEVINANNGLVIGSDSSLVSGEIGVGRAFNANLPAGQSPTYIDVPAALDSAGLLNFNSSSFSIELWLNSLQGGEAPVVDKRQFISSGSPVFSGYYFYLLNGSPMLQLGDGVAVTTFASSAPGAATGAWSDVAVSVDQANLLVTMYVNGNKYPATPSRAYTAPIATAPVGPNPPDLWIGASQANPGGAPCFVGAMDELTLYSVALTQPQAAYIFHQGTNGTCADGITPGAVVPVSAPYYLGQWAQFQVAVSSPSLPVSFQWYTNGVPVYNNAFTFGAQSNILTLFISDIRQATNVSVRVSSVLGYTYSPAVPLQILPLTASAAIVGANSTWKYSASGADPGVNWNQSGFNDGAWASGSGLFGFAPPGIWPAAIQTAVPPPAVGGPITVYYRSAFQWTGATNDVNLVTTNFIQDGAVFYINGAEAGRLRVPPNQNYLTLASPQPTPGQPETIAFPVGSLRPGTNLLAVEVHQSSTNASQDVFGLGLTANVSMALIPMLTITNSGGSTVVSWSGSGSLQTTPSLLLPWTNLPASNPYVTPMTNGARFYRLRTP